MKITLSGKSRLVKYYVLARFIKGCLNWVIPNIYMGSDWAPWRSWNQPSGIGKLPFNIVSFTWRSWSCLSSGDFSKLRIAKNEIHQTILHHHLGWWYVWNLFQASHHSKPKMTCHHVFKVWCGVLCTKRYWLAGFQAFNLEVLLNQQLARGACDKSYSITKYNN